MNVLQLPLPPQPTLVSERLMLRPLELGDAAIVSELAGDARIAATTLTVPHPYTFEQAQEWIARIVEEELPESMRFAIVDLEQECLVGVLGLDVEQEHARAELGYWIGVPYWGQGFATEAAREAVQYVFEDLALQRVFASVMDHNRASQRVLEKIGMRREGTYRRHVRKGSEYFDVLLFGVLRDEFVSASAG